jgi:hypothetical protein
MKNLQICMLICLMFLAGTTPAIVVNVDFGLYDYRSTNGYVGQGALPDPGNNFWNNISNGWDSGAVSNNLVASDGVTATDFDWVFNSVTYTFTPSDFSTITQKMLADGRRTFSANQACQFTLSSLTPNTKYTLYLYGGNHNSAGTKFTLNGVTGQTTGTMGLGAYVDGGNYVILVVTSDAAGQIIGTFEAAVPGVTEAPFNGFQITDVVAARGAAHTPVPASGDKQVDKALLTSVSWYSPEQDSQGNSKDDPNIVSVTGYDVWFGTSEPNEITGAPITTNQSGQNYTVGTLAYNTNYYWRVDTHVVWDSNSFTGTSSTTSVVKGNVWQFKTNPEYLIPVVTFANVRTAIPLFPAVLSPVVTGNSMPITSITFTALYDYQQPTGGIITLEDKTTDKQYPTAWATANMPGKYKVKVAISDGTTTVEKMAEVMIYATACEARKATSGWVANYYDRGGDCLVDTSDFSTYVDNWLNDTSLKAQQPYVKTVTVLNLDIKVEFEAAYLPADPNYTTNAPLDSYGAPAIGLNPMASGGEQINNFDTAGFLLTYQVVVPQAGNYTLYVMSQHDWPRILSFDLVTSVSPDGNPANDTLTNLTTMTLSGNGPWIWRLDSKAVTLTAGTHLIRISRVDGYGLSLDFFGFKKQ